MPSLVGTWIMMKTHKMHASESLKKNVELRAFNLSSSQSEEKKEETHDAT